MKLSKAILLASASAGLASAFVPTTTWRTQLVEKSMQSSSILNVPSSHTTALSMATYVEQGIYQPSFMEAPPITREEVRALFSLWNDALATGDSRIVASRYAAEPVLLPTVSDKPRTDFASVKDYFDAFLLKKPQGRIVEGFIKIGNGWASDTGIYEFTMGIDGSKVKARYSFLYVYENGQWKISHHHSSVMPEEIALGRQISEDDVRGLFQLWNNALLSGDPKQVASRYARKGVLLPTVSDKPRTDFHSIANYFETFLQKKPSGTILESNVMIGKNWAQDAGIYEFTMGIDGSKVKARYSFVYVFEDDEWKIAHHHSSVMPEGITVGQQITEDQVRQLFYLWNDALATGNPRKVADRYAKKSVLLPTVSDQPRTDYYGIVDYFKDFLQKRPQGRIIDSNVIVGTNWAQDAGIYEFTMGVDGSVVRARYTFIYVYEDGEWKISQHHSSIMPEAVLNKPKLSVPQVQNLFYLWNDALATLDPDAVTARYSKNAVLLPTVSDTPRTTPAMIRDYFVNFLQKRPQGTILQSHVQIGDSWCKDSGIYEFTMGVDGTKVKARYTFVYVYEDGMWKISHHHSSVMPEALLNSSSASSGATTSQYGGNTVDENGNLIPLVEQLMGEVKSLTSIVAEQERRANALLSGNPYYFNNNNNGQSQSYNQQRSYNGYEQRALPASSSSSGYNSNNYNGYNSNNYNGYNNNYNNGYNNNNYNGYEQPRTTTQFQEQWEAPSATHHGAEGEDCFHARREALRNLRVDVLWDTPRNRRIR